MKQISDKNAEGRDFNDLKDWIPKDPDYDKFRNRLILGCVFLLLLILKCFGLI